jgi:hypothetical protein
MFRVQKHQLATVIVLLESMLMFMTAVKPLAAALTIGERHV